MIYLALLCAFLFGYILCDLIRDWLDARLYADEWDAHADDARRGVDEWREEF